MKYLLILTLLASPLLTKAQRFNGGFLGGLNASQVDGDTYSGYNKFGLALGAYTYLPLSEILDLQFEIKYNGKGARSKPTMVGTEYTRQLNYIELPLLLRINSNSGIGFEIGSGIGYLFGSTFKNINGTVFNDDTFNKLEWSGILGMQYPVTQNINVNLRFSYSLTTIKDNLNNQVEFRRGGIYNNMLCIAIYYALGNAD